jgi:SulP family sulfate permease
MKRFAINRKTIGSDLVAGLTLGIESVPDSMAAAVLAGVNPIHGLYAVMLSTPVGALFTSSAFMSVQTTSAMSLLVASTAAVQAGENAMQALFLLAVLTGIFMLTLGLLKLGWLTRFVPNSVMVGFINGVAVLIILGQVGDFTGFSSRWGNKVAQAIDTFFKRDQIDLPTLTVGIATILLIVVLQDTRIGSFSMVVALIVASLLVPLFDWDSVTLVEDLSEIPSILPRPVLPNFSLLPALIVPAISLAIVGLVQGAGVSQSYKNPDGKYPDASADFAGQGVANIAAGVFHGMPVGGSLSATALVVNSGAKSRWANIFAGLVIALTLVLFGSLVGKLAMPALAGLLMVVGFNTLRIDDVKTVWNTGPVQQAVMTITLVATLIMPLQYAVFLGVALAIILYVFNQSNRITLEEWVLTGEGELPLERSAPEELPADQATILVPYGSLFFAAAPTFEELLPDPEHTRHAVAILNIRGVAEVGSTFLEVLERYVGNLREKESRLVLAEVSRAVRDQFVQTKFIRVIGRHNVYMATERYGESLLDAYDQANEWINQVGRGRDG